MRPYDTVNIFTEADIPSLQFLHNEYAAGKHSIPLPHSQLTSQQQRERRALASATISRTHFADVVVRDSDPSNFAFFRRPDGYALEGVTLNATSYERKNNG